MKDGAHGDAAAQRTSGPPESLGHLDIQQIMELLPHRYPMLLVDRIEDIVLGESCVGIKNVTANEPHFVGHFPGRPVMPGVLIVEAMAQTAGALVVHSSGSSAVGKLVYFLWIDGCRFRKPVVPGDQLRIYMTKQQQRGSVWKFYGEAKVDGAVVAEGTVAAMLTDRQ